MLSTDDGRRLLHDSGTYLFVLKRDMDALYIVTVEWVNKATDSNLGASELSIDTGKRVFNTNWEELNRSEEVGGCKELSLATCSAQYLREFLQRCEKAGVRVLAYHDQAGGVRDNSERTTEFSEILLRPRIVVASAAMVKKAHELLQDIRPQSGSFRASRQIRYLPFCTAESAK